MRILQKGLIGVSIDIRLDDSPEEIQMCLNCKRPTCVNCLDAHFTESTRMTNTKQRVRELWERGLNDTKIAKYLGLSASHVSHLRNQMLLPKIKERGPRGPYGPRKQKTV